MSENSSKLTQTKWLTRNETRWATVCQPQLRKLVSWDHLDSSCSLWIKTSSVGVCIICFFFSPVVVEEHTFFCHPKKQSLELQKKWQSLEIRTLLRKQLLLPCLSTFKYSCWNQGTEFLALQDCAIPLRGARPLAWEVKWRYGSLAFPKVNGQKHTNLNHQLTLIDIHELIEIYIVSKINTLPFKHGAWEMTFSFLGRPIFPFGKKTKWRILPYLFINKRQRANRQTHQPYPALDHLLRKWIHDERHKTWMLVAGNRYTLQ